MPHMLPGVSSSSPVLMAGSLSAILVECKRVSIRFVHRRQNLVAFKKLSRVLLNALVPGLRDLTAYLLAQRQWHYVTPLNETTDASSLPDLRFGDGHRLL